MSYVSVTELLVKTLLPEGDIFSVKEYPTLEDDYLLIKVLVDSDNLGKVIGKKGKIANAIRNITQATVTNEYRFVKIEFESL